MAEWYFSREDIENESPSRMRGMSRDAEMKLRKEGAKLIMDCGNALGLYPQNIFRLYSFHASWLGGAVMTTVGHGFFSMAVVRPERIKEKKGSVPFSAVVRKKSCVNLFMSLSDHLVCKDFGC